MGATADTIWSVPAYLPYLQPPLTDDVVAAAEKKIGYRLPTEFLDLLRKQNGGYIRFSLPKMVHDSIAGIGPHFPSLTEFDWEEFQEYVSFPLQGLVPFDGDGHWYLCLDYRRSSRNPSVTYADVECDEESQVAESFPEYLTMLRIEIEDEYVLEEVSDIQKVTSELASSLKTVFEPPNSWAHGYPIHRARLGTNDNPEWIWISPNTVPRGFVRTNDRRYEELKDLMPGNASRYPEVPANSYILGATDGFRATVIEACVRSGFAVRPLREYVKDT